MRRWQLQASLAFVALLPLLGSAPAARAQAGFVLEMQLPTGENPFARFVYPCPACTPAQHAAALPPPGFVSQAAKLFLPSSVSAEPIEAPPGVPAALDLVPEIPGPDYVLVAKALGGQILGFDPTLGPFAVVQVQRHTRFVYDPGEVVHLATDPAGQRYVLFSFDLEAAASIDVTQPGALTVLPFPPGWSYASRVLESDLLVVSNGLASVFAQGPVASWQRIEELDVAVDVKPGSDRNPVNPRSRGSIPVAILGEADFDVTTIDVPSLAFGPAAAAPVHGGHLEDVDGDGIPDLLAHFRTQESGIASGQPHACVSGETLEGTVFEGCDAIATLR